MSRIVIEPVSCELRIYHTDFEITETEGGQFVRNEWPEPPALASEFLQITGVEILTVRPYSINLHKGLAFDWEPIESQVLAILKLVASLNAPLDSLPGAKICADGVLPSTACRISFYADCAN